MKTLNVLVLGFPHAELTGDPLQTLYGIRVRDWALFTLLPRYGIQADIYVQPSATVAPEIDRRYGQRLVRDPERMLAQCSDGRYDCVIVSGTKLHELRRQNPLVDRLQGVDLFGALCYDNDPSPIPASFTDRLIGVTFTSPLHKRHWEGRGIGVPAVLITTGQTPRGPCAYAGDGSVLFMGYVHSAAHLHKMALMAQRDSGREYHVVSSFIRRLKAPGKVYDSLPRMAADERERYFRDYVSEIAGFFPENLRYHFLPPGSEGELMDRVSVGLDFSWSGAQTLENSKLCHYLTHGIAPVAQLPAPSFRYVHRFGHGAVVPFDASVEQWVDAIGRCARSCTLERRNEVRREAGSVFNWENVAFEVASFLIDHYCQRELLP